MKRLTLISILLLTACTQSPDFSNPVEVMEKVTNEGVSVYTLRKSQGFKSEFFGPVEFAAPQELAKVGDIIQFHRGAIRIKKESWK